MRTRGPTPERLALAERVRVLHDVDGLSFTRIRERLGISRSYASALYNDADGSGARARKEGYSGACVDCGAPTSGSNGPDLTPERCVPCARKLAHETRQWTREAVIEAIQRFAATHGRPPITHDWFRADQVNGYPASGTVYGKAAPFALWADAVEAAGFARPYSGRRTWKEIGMGNRSGYVILRERDDGAWELLGESEESSQVLALNAAMNGAPAAGRWVAVPLRFWRPRGLKARTIYEFVEEDLADGNVE